MDLSSVALICGLKVGAPVELQGIQIGQVLDVSLEFDADKEAFRIPVLIELEPGRIEVVGQRFNDPRQALIELLYAAELAPSATH